MVPVARHRERRRKGSQQHVGPIASPVIHESSAIRYGVSLFTTDGGRAEDLSRPWADSWMSWGRQLAQGARIPSTGVTPAGEAQDLSVLEQSLGCEVEECDQPFFRG